MNEMIQLTLEQEKNILNSIKHDRPLGNGAARIVYDLDLEAWDSLGLKEQPFDLVVKVAVGLGGLQQNKREREIFEDYGDEFPLAVLVAYGRYINVMESVVIDHRIDCDLCDEFDMDAFEYCAWYEERIEAQEALNTKEGFETAETIKNKMLTKEQAYAAEEAFQTLCYEFGDTRDNAQLGWSTDGGVVCYDYGFDRYNESDRQTSNIHYGFMRNKVDGITTYINGLIDMIGHESVFCEYLERLFAGEELEEIPPFDCEEAMYFYESEINAELLERRRRCYG